MSITAKEIQEIKQIEKILPWHETEAERILNIWRKTGLSLIEFCRRYNVKYKRFNNWATKLKMSRYSPCYRGLSSAVSRSDSRGLSAEKGMSKVSLDNVGFVEVSMPSLSEGVCASDMMEVVLLGGRRIRILPGFNSDAIRRLLPILE